MYTLGIGDVTHDVSVALAKNGKIVAVCELERISRIKHGLSIIAKNYSVETQNEEFFGAIKHWSNDFRTEQIAKCIDYCLEQENIQASDIDLTITSSLFKPPVQFKNNKIIDHHAAHTASTFYPSPYAEAAILTIDGCGEIHDYQSESARYSIGNKDGLEILKNINCSFNLTAEEKQASYGHPHMVLANSLGTFYQNMTILIGMGYFCEGKSMGLSSYGKPNKSFDFIRDYIQLLSAGEIKIDNRSIFLNLQAILKQASLDLSTKELFQFKADTAYAHQIILEEIIIYMCTYLYQETKLKNLCLSGGVALNSVANGKILKKTPFESIFIQPAAGDNGISIGCAMYGEHITKSHKKFYSGNNIFSPYLGKDYISENSDHLTKNLLELKTDESIYKTVAQLITEGYIIAWYNGRSEIGPRALGNRSILADPRIEAMKDILNKRVKHREPFRPFAPAILQEYADEYFIIDELSPYMLVVSEVKENKKAIIPAVTHIDGTARLQTVSNESNYDFYRLIEEFYLLTGVPVLLNTSFNDAGQPIVESPSEAIAGFLKMDIDALMLNGKLYVKEYTQQQLALTTSISLLETV